MPDEHPETSAICAWLIGHARLISVDSVYLNAFGERLVEAGLPVKRVSTGIPTLHPQLFSVLGLWEQGKGTTGRGFQMLPETRHMFDNSPLRIVYEEGRPVRCLLEEPPVEGEFGVLADLRSDGLTDYVVMPLPFSDGTFKAVSYATDRPGGFEPAELRLFETITPYVSALEEAIYMRTVMRTLLDTYVGTVAGQRVLDGAIKRGMQETIRAVIWFSDLKGFTTLSEHVSGDVLIGLLNEYFEIVTSSIEAQNGEVLKFIGDAVMAIFQPDSDDPTDAAVRALAAARSCEALLAERNDGLAGDDHQIDFGIALHFGDVLYGNVGGENRLDFTVVGPAVNLASRIEGLTRQLSRPILVSQDFARIHGGAFENLGHFDFKGIDTEHTVFAPDAAETEF